MKPNIQQFRTHETTHEVLERNRQKLSFLEQIIPLMIKQVRNAHPHDINHDKYQHKLNYYAEEYAKITGHPFGIKSEKAIREYNERFVG